MAAAVPSPNPVPSPELTARERRANYQNTVPAPSPSPAGPPSEPAPVEGETPGVAEVVGMVSNNTFVYINPMQCISYYVSSWCDLSIYDSNRFRSFQWCVAMVHMQKTSMFLYIKNSKGIPKDHKHLII